MFFRTAVLVLDHCDYRLALEHGAKLGSGWQCANMTKLRPGPECSNIFATCHTLLDLTGPLQLGALPGESPGPRMLLVSEILKRLPIGSYKDKSKDIFHSQLNISIFNQFVQSSKLSCRHKFSNFQSDINF